MATHYGAQLAPQSRPGQAMVMARMQHQREGRIRVGPPANPGESAQLDRALLLALTIANRFRPSSSTTTATEGSSEAMREVTTS